MNQPYAEARNMFVVKSNNLIRLGRFDLDTNQQKMLLYVISKIKAEDKDFHEYALPIIEMCNICGISIGGGKQYKMLYEALKKMADKSIWMPPEVLGGDESAIVRIFRTCKVNEKQGLVKIELDPNMKPFLLALQKDFTKYELFWVLQFRSKYSIRLYEYLKSFHYSSEEEYVHRVSLNDFKELLKLPNYEYKHIRQKILDVAVEEINHYSDKVVMYEPIREGRTVVAIDFTIRTKDVYDRLLTNYRGNDELDSKIRKPKHSTIK